nr:MAG TPA: hypothetical protein [Caudoviricetes sp.]
MISLGYSRFCFSALPISPSINRDINSLGGIRLSPIF